MLLPICHALEAWTWWPTGFDHDDNNDDSQALQLSALARYLLGVPKP